MGASAYFLLLLSLVYIRLQLQYSLVFVRDQNRSDRPTGAYGLAYARPDQTFFLNKEDLAFFRSLFSLKGQATGHSKSLLGLLGRPI